MVLCNLFLNTSFRVKKLKFQIKNMLNIYPAIKNAQFQKCYNIVKTIGDKNKIKG